MKESKIIEIENKNGVDLDSPIEEFKKDYLEVQEVYSFPDFELLNADFGIEKIADIETDFLVREIRKCMSDKFSNYLRFLDGILHPTGTQMFVFSIIKSISNGENLKLLEAYKKLARFEVDLIELDIEFNEEKEAEFIIESYKIWQEVKKDLLKVVAVIKKNWDNNLEFNVHRKDYFG